MVDRDGDAMQQLIGALEIATVLSVSVLWTSGFVSFEDSVVALLTMVALVLVIR